MLRSWDEMQDIVPVLLKVRIFLVPLKHNAYNMQHFLKTAKGQHNLNATTLL